MARGRREDRTMADKTFRWFAGVDWGSAKHQACLLDEVGTVVGERAFAHGGAGLAAIALREWSHLAEELQQERVRLSNRIRQQLWRYYPQLLEVSDDVTAEWVLDLWPLAEA